MEENTNTAGTTQAENMGTQSEGNTASGDTQKKLFTQEEVNGFVQSRLSKYKGQLEKESRAEYDKKLQELQQRELKLLVKEKLSERDMPRELADIISCTDEADLKNKLDTLQKVYGSAAAEKSKEPAGFIQIGATGGDGYVQGPDPIRKAMGLCGKD